MLFVGLYKNNLKLEGNSCTGVNLILYERVKNFCSSFSREQELLRIRESIDKYYFTLRVRDQSSKCAFISIFEVPCYIYLPVYCIAENIAHLDKYSTLGKSKFTRLRGTICFH